MIEEETKLNEASRIWVLSTEFEPHIIGGLGTSATKLTRAYARSGALITVLSQSKHARLLNSKQQQLHIVRFPKTTRYYSATDNQYKPVAIERWMAKRGYRIPSGIHIHSLQFSNVAKHFQSKYGIPVVYTCHSLIANEKGPNSKHKRQALKHQVQLLKTANNIVVPSQSELDLLKRKYPFCANRLSVIRHGVISRKQTARGPRHRLLFVGRLVPVKGVAPLLEAVAKLKQSGNKVKLDLVGTGSKSYTKYLKALVKKLGISSEVRWLGFRSHKQVQSMYASYGAVILPSLQESFGLVAVEALASGVPLVATRAGGLAESVNSKVAQTIPRANSTAIAKAIQSMWNHKKLTDRRISAGLRWVSRFSWPRAATRYRGIFKQLEKTKNLREGGRFHEVQSGSKAAFQKVWH